MLLLATRIAMVLIALALAGLVGCARGSGGPSRADGERTTAAATSAPTSAPPVVPTTFVSVPGLTDDDVRDYLVSLAFSSGVTVNTVLKWQAPISVFLYGEATPQDRAAVEATLTDLQKLTGISMSMATAPGRENMAIRFVPIADFLTYVKNLLPADRVGFNVFRSGEGIGNATIVIDSSATPAPLTPGQRAALVKRMITQSLGLVYVGNNRYPDSVFYGRYANQTSELSTLDRKVIQLFYSDRVKIGMTEAELRRALTQ